MQKIPEDVAERLKLLLAAIAKLFKAPKITLIVRSGDNATGDLVLSNDNPTLALMALRTHMVAEAKAFAAAGARSAKSGEPDPEWPRLRNIDELM